jgi:hypothetical protein
VFYIITEFDVLRPDENEDEYYVSLVSGERVRVATSLIRNKMRKTEWDSTTIELIAEATAISFRNQKSSRDKKALILTNPNE